MQRVQHLLQLAVSGLGIGQAGHSADHAGRPSPLIAGDMGALLENGVGTVRPPEAVLLGPGRAALADGGIDTGNHSLAVRRMNAVVPPGRRAAKLRRVVVEEIPGTEIPDDMIRRKIPVPNHFPRGNGQQAMTFLAFSKGELGLFALGDVLDAGDEVPWLAFRARYQG